MRVGLFYQIQVPKPWTPSSESQRIHEALEQIPYAEEMGFASVWFSEHHFRPVWSHNSAPDLTLAAVSQRTSRIRLGVGVVLAPIHHPLHVAARMATLDILSRGRVDVGLGRTGYPYQLTPYGSDLRDTRGMWEEFAEVLPRIWTQEVVSYDGTYFQIPPREVLPKPVQRPHPPLWSACGSDETARLTGSLGMGGLFGSEGGPDRVGQLMALYRESLRSGAIARSAPGTGAGPAPRAALMTAGYCHEDARVVAERGTELVGWYLEQQRERARLVWRDYDPGTVPPDYQGYYARDQRLASGPHPGEPTPQEVREQGTKFCVGTPADCIRFLEIYEALGIEEVFLLCAIGPAQHQEVLNTIRLFGEEVIPHFQAREPLTAAVRVRA
ncbi:MAG TPA: LLM class flavin-dependent oxidoreductase [Stellaceae bacterium]|jgi:alkanesulfonate monooxygenase SsuD/methylene tetrahydromethanopterin reductase-like flavin-dependent oxidoreductase (luciferase family)